MDKKTVIAPNISCGHCVATIEREIAALDGVSSVSADAGSKKVEIQWSAPATWERIAAELEEIGYPAEE